MKKLTLNRETLAELAEADLAAVQGGINETTMIVKSIVNGCPQFTWERGCSHTCTV